MLQMADLSTVHRLKACKCAQYGCRHVSQKRLLHCLSSCVMMSTNKYIHICIRLQILGCCTQVLIATKYSYTAPISSKSFWHSWLLTIFLSMSFKLSPNVLRNNKMHALTGYNIANKPACTLITKESCHKGGGGTRDLQRSAYLMVWFYAASDTSATNASGITDDNFSRNSSCEFVC